MKPAFLRACHSPWRFIPQNVLVILRGLTLAYLTAVGIMAINYKLSLESEFSGWRHLFDFAVVSFVLVFVYHLITFVRCPTYSMFRCGSLLTTFEVVDIHPSVPPQP